MSAPFSQTLRALAADGYGRALAALVAAVVLLGAWGAWAVGARVTVVETTELARLEVQAAPHAVDTEIGGRVAVNRLLVGREVAAGEVLVELEATGERLRLSQAKARLAGLGPQRTAVLAQVEAEAGARASDRQAARHAIEEAQARTVEASSSAELAREASRRAEELHGRGALPELELSRARSEASRGEAATSAQRADVSRLERDREARQQDARARRAERQRQLADLDAQIVVARAEVAAVEAELDRRRIRAPIAGRIGEAEPLEVGRVLGAGQRLATILPPGALRVVAEFAPASALGRLRPGQPGRLRLAGYPWTEYGTVAVTVDRVAAEARYGRLRVELAPQADPRSRIPLQHGLVGSVEVEVEAVSPATLVLRAAGKLLAASRPREGG